MNHEATGRVTLTTTKTAIARFRFTQTVKLTFYPQCNQYAIDLVLYVRLRIFRMLTSSSDHGLA